MHKIHVKDHDNIKYRKCTKYILKTQSLGLTAQAQSTEKKDGRPHF
jgi:hypothetical protein